MHEVVLAITVCFFSLWPRETKRFGLIIMKSLLDGEFFSCSNLRINVVRCSRRLRDTEFLFSFPGRASSPTFSCTLGSLACCARVPLRANSPS